MVAHALALILVIGLAGLPALGGEPRQQCLECHRGHHSDRGTCVGCHRGNPASGRGNIAHHGLIAGRFARFTLPGDPAAREGRRLLDQFSCRRCHVTAGRGNRLAADLDSLRRDRNPGEIVAVLGKPAPGMPDFNLSEQQAVLLVNAILAGADDAKDTRKNRPRAVHFEGDDQRKRDVFSRKCGACHRALTTRLGTIGQGNIGPNLSGLLSRWYPKTFRDGGEWSRKALEDWLRNPRRVRSQTRMQPVELTAAELEQLVGLLRPDPD